MFKPLYITIPHSSLLSFKHIYVFDNYFLSIDYMTITFSIQLAQLLNAFLKKKKTVIFHITTVFLC